MTQEIYISEWLEKDYKDVYNQLLRVLAEFDITPKTLPYSEEVWCKDYMPIHIGEGKYVGFNFRPDYLWDDQKYHKYITRQELAIEDLDINISDNVDIVLDGGNYVRCGDKVVMTDKIFSENTNWRPLALLCRLEEAFQAEIILLPWDMNEPFGHSDGMIAWLGDDRILLNNYHQLENGKRKSFSTRIRKILNSQFEILELEYKGMLSQDIWCYMNYLETFTFPPTHPNTTNVFLSKDCCQGRTSPGRRVRASCHGSLCRGLGQSCGLAHGCRAPRDSSRAAAHSRRRM